MKIHGHLKYCLRDKEGNIKQQGEGNNTVTNLGKLTFLFGGLGDLFDNTTIYGNRYKSYNGVGTTGADVNKTAGQNAKNMLLAMGNASLEGKLFFTPSDAQLIGYASTATAATGAAKEGIRVLTVDPLTGDQIVTTPTKTAATYKYMSESEGDIDTIAMQIPAAAVGHDLPRNIETNTHKPLPPGSYGLDANHIGLYNTSTSAYDKQMSLQDMSISDFTPTGTISSYFTAADYITYCFEWSDYIITAIRYTNTMQPGSDITYLQALGVYNKTTGQFAITNMDTTIKNACSQSAYLIIYNSNLYLATYGSTTTYQITVAGTAPTLTASAVSKSDILDTSKATQYTVITPFNIGTEQKYVSNVSGTLNVFSGAKDGIDSVSIPNSYRDMPVYINKIFGYRYVYSDNRAYYYYIINCIGNLFSYFTLDETLEKGSGDELTLTYYYELEEGT